MKTSGVVMMVTKIRKVFGVIFVLIMLFVFGQASLKANGQEVDVNITATIDGDNTEVPLLVGKRDYGANIVPNLDSVDGTFAFWIVNGVIDVNREKNTSFRAINDLNAVAVFYKESQSAAVYIDHSGILLDSFYNVDEPNPDEPDKIGYNFDGWLEISEPEDHVKVYKATYTLDHADVKVNEVDTRYNSVVNLEGDENKVWVKDGKVVSYNKDYAFSALKDTTVAQRALDEGEVAKSLVTLELLEGYRTGHTTYLAQVELLDGEIVEYGLEVDGVLRKAAAIHELTNEFLISTTNTYSAVRAYAVVEVNEAFAYIYSDYVNYITDAEIIYDFSDITDKGKEVDALELMALLQNEHLEKVSDVTKVWLGNQSGSTNYSGVDGLLKTGTSNDEGNIVFEFKGNVVINTVVLYVAAWNDSTKTIKVNGVDIADQISTMESRVVITLPEKTNVVTLNTAKQGLFFGVEFYGEDVEIKPASTVDVTFNYNDEEQTDDLVKTIFKNRKVFAPANPVREDYEFLGWFEDLQDELPFNFADNISDDVILYAKWEELSTDLIFFAEFNDLPSISYSATDHVFTNNVGDDMAWILKEVYHSSGQPDKDMLRLKGAELAYIYTEKAIEEVGSISFDAKPYSSANDTAVIKVYYLEIGEIEWIQVGDSIIFEDLDFKNVSIDIEKENVRIKIEVTVKTVNIDNLKIFGSHEAEVEDPTYTVTFNTNGGTPVPSQQTLKIFDKITKPADPEKTDSTFLGWFEKADFSENAWNFDTDLMPNHNITLYARFEAGQVESIIYSTGWEDVNVSGNPSYSNNIINSNDVEWELSQGDVVTTGTPLTGSKNAQFRIYKENSGTGILNMKDDFIDKEITKISFNASMPNQANADKYLKIYYKLSTGGWVLFKTVAPGTSKTPFEVDFKDSSNQPIEGIVNVKIEISYSANVTANRDIKIDDIVIYGYNQ